MENLFCNEVSVPWVLKTYFKLQDDSLFFVPSKELMMYSIDHDYLEFALFNGNQEVNYPGYSRVKLLRSEDTFSLTLENSEIVIKPKEHIDFPEVRGYTKSWVIKTFCKARAEAKTDAHYVASHFRIYLGSLKIAEGTVHPEIFLSEGTLPRITNRSTLSFKLGSM